jgi:hypothetical protein
VWRVALVAGQSIATDVATDATTKAGELTWALNVNAPNDSGCVDTAQLARWVSARAGRDAFAGTQPADATVAVHITRREQGKGFVAVVTTRDAAGRTSGQRELQSEGELCSEMDDALVFVVAALVGVDEPEESLAATPQEPTTRDEQVSVTDGQGQDARATDPSEDAVNSSASSEPSDAADAPNPSDAPDSPVSEAPSPPWQWHVGAGVGVASGALPGTALSAQFSLSGRFRDLVFAVEGLGFPYRSTTLDDGGTGWFRMLAASLRLCGVAIETSRSRFALCAGATSGAVWAGTDGLWRNARSVQPWLSVGPSAKLDLDLIRPISLQFWLGLAIPILNRQFYYRRPGGVARTYHETKTGAWLHLAVVWQFAS